MLYLSRVQNLALFPFLFRVSLSIGFRNFVPIGWFSYLLYNLNSWVAQSTNCQSQEENSWETSIMVSQRTDITRRYPWGIQTHSHPPCTWPNVWVGGILGNPKLKVPSPVQIFIFLEKGGYTWQPKTQGPNSWPNFHSGGGGILGNPKLKVLIPDQIFIIMTLFTIYNFWGH